MVRAMRSESVTRRRLTADEYQRMIRVGILRDGERVELLDGEMYQMAAQASPHVACVMRLNRRFVVALGDRALVSAQGAMRLSAYSEPEPDIAVLRYRDDFYEGALPQPGDVFLVIEVANSSLRHDRDRKLPLYAAGGVSEVWIVDLRGRRVLAYREPTPDGYRQNIAYTEGASISPLAFPDLVIGWEDIFGRGSYGNGPATQTP
jgi:Uma2 family endonuclease